MASTNKGDVYCFARTRTEAPLRDANRKPPPGSEVPERIRKALRGIDLSGITKGYALVVGSPDAGLAEALAGETSLHVIALLGDDTKVRSERERLLDTTSLYGSRVVVDGVGDSPSLPYPPHFGNLIVVAGDPRGISPKELYRLLRPCGGRLTFAGPGKDVGRGFIRAAEIAESEVRDGPGALSVVRGALDGAFDWNSKATCDERLRWPLELLWFGGPGPGRMIDRHWRGPAPVAANGRCFIVAHHGIIAIDAYNGTELWSYPLRDAFATENPRAAKERVPGALGGITADSDHVYLLVRGQWRRLDAQTGEPAGVLKNLPDGLQRWSRRPQRTTPPSLRRRVHPITGTPEQRAYARAYGCGPTIPSATMDFFRSGTLGFFDLTDDSGIRNFGGVKPGCGRSFVPALGLLLVPEGSSGCACSYNFQTSLALVPAPGRRNEDWALFYDHPVDGPVRTAALNFGAPGDRRDEGGALWLSYPRPVVARAAGRELGIEIQMTVEGGSEPETYRFNADRSPVGGTQRPWIYASGYRGLRKAVMHLTGHKPIISLPAARAPTIDGSIDDACWDDKSPVILPSLAPRLAATVLLRHDSENLYASFHLPSHVDRKNQRRPWIAAAKGRDAPVWKDDSWELFISDDNAKRYVHFAVSASGARYDAMCDLTTNGRNENSKWNSTWTAATRLTEDSFTAEMAIPWKTLKAVGLLRGQVAINICSFNSQGGRGWRVSAPRVRNERTGELRLTHPGDRRVGEVRTFHPAGDRSASKVIRALLHRSPALCRTGYLAARWQNLRRSPAGRAGREGAGRCQGGGRDAAGAGAGIPGHPGARGTHARTDSVAGRRLAHLTARYQRNGTGGRALDGGAYIHRRP